jgi:hypothetical protein
VLKEFEDFSRNLPLDSIRIYIVKPLFLAA